MTEKNSREERDRSKAKLGNKRVRTGGSAKMGYLRAHAKRHSFGDETGKGARTPLINWIFSLAGLYKNYIECKKVTHSLMAFPPTVSTAPELNHTEPVPPYWFFASHTGERERETSDAQRNDELMSQQSESEHFSCMYVDVCMMCVCLFVCMFVFGFVCIQCLYACMYIIM